MTQHTWFNSGNNGQCSRLDYWLISINLFDNVSKCEISAAPLLDHCVISLSLKFHYNEVTPHPIWQFNNNLLDNPDFKSKESAIKIIKYVSKLKKQKHQLIIREINSLCHKVDLSVEEHRLNCLQTELDNLYLEKANGAFIHSRARWLEEGEKNSSYFLNLEKQRQTNKKIQMLLINDVNITYSNISKR